MKPIEEPVRWLDARSDAPEDVRQLLALGRGALDPTPEDMARLSASVATAAGGGAAGAVAAKVAAAHGHALTASVVKVVAVLVVAGAAGGTGWAVLRSAETASAPTASQAGHASSVEAPLAPIISQPPPSDETVIMPAATTTAIEAASSANVTSAPPRTGSGAVSAAPAAATVEVPPVAAVPSELALLDRARTRMAADPGDALRALDEHRARYPRGTFVQEREVLAIEALVHLVRRPEAESRAAAFANEFPDSAHRRRIAVLLGTQAK
jgi:hypothetical protein